MKCFKFYGSNAFNSVKDWESARSFQHVSETMVLDLEEDGYHRHVMQ